MKINFLILNYPKIIFLIILLLVNKFYGNNIYITILFLFLFLILFFKFHLKIYKLILDKNIQNILFSKKLKK